MATVTISRSYFDALVRRTPYHASTQSAKYGTDLSDNITITRAEHDHMTQALREYRLLKSALLRGGLTIETLETLLHDEHGGSADEDLLGYDHGSEYTPFGTRARAEREYNRDSIVHDRHSAVTRSYHQTHGEGEPFMWSPANLQDDDEEVHAQSLIRQIPLHDKRTILVTNLSERTTHKDLVGIIRGGRLLDIYLRGDRSAAISFVEGAAEFLAYTKRNDIYLHTKRLEFRWHERQFYVPSHVSTKIANGATRNLVVRGIARKFTADQIRDHLDHIHNLVVIDIYFKNGDAYISTNSVHNALFARTCMMSRTGYKCMRIEHYPDECAEPLRQPAKASVHVQHAPMKSAPPVNQFALLDIGADDDSDSEEDSYRVHGVHVGGCRLADGLAA